MYPFKSSFLKQSHFDIVLITGKDKFLPLEAAGVHRSFRTVWNMLGFKVAKHATCLMKLSIRTAWAAQRCGASERVGKKISQLLNKIFDGQSLNLWLTKQSGSESIFDLLILGEALLLVLLCWIEKYVIPFNLYFLVLGVILGAGPMKF